MYFSKFNLNSHFDFVEMAEFNFQGKLSLDILNVKILLCLNHFRVYYSGTN